MLEWNDYIKLTVSLIAITSPVAALAVYLGLTEKLTHSAKHQVVLIATGLYAIILLAFTFFGEDILAFFSISIDAFKVAGGILLFLTALDMLGNKAPAKTDESYEDASPFTLALVPLTIPLLAGPGTISTIIVYTHAHPSVEHDLMMTGVILTVTALIYLLFIFASKVSHWIHGSASELVNRITGLILAALGVEFIFAGIAAHFALNLPAM